MNHIKRVSELSKNINDVLALFKVRCLSYTILQQIRAGASQEDILANTGITLKTYKYIVWSIYRKFKKSKISVEAIPESKQEIKPILQEIKPILSSFHGLVGYNKYLEDIKILTEAGTKAVFIGGFHGLGKSCLVEAYAKEKNAKLVRIQITEMTSEVDIIGGLDLKSGEFINSEFVNNLLEAKENISQEYFVLLDEFTRGREEALNILFPLLAEKKLIINSPYSKIKEIIVNGNVKIFATGNLHDTGQRTVGQAELDRYNCIEILPIQETSLLHEILNLKVENSNRLVNETCISFYLHTWKAHAEERILAMSIRTLIEVSMLANSIVDSNPLDSVKKALKLSYYCSSQAIIDPNYARTYNELIREMR